MTKNKGQLARINRRKHLKKRFWQRYGMIINRDDVKLLSSMIKKRQCKILRQLTNSRLLIKLEFRKKDVYLVYSKESNLCVTVLTKEQVDQNIES